MELNSAFFLLFLGVACLANYLVPKKIRYIWLLVCSYAFYLYDPIYFTSSFNVFIDFVPHLWPLGLLIGATLVSYGCGFGIAKFKNIFLKRFFLVLSVVCCLAPLLFYQFLYPLDAELIRERAIITGSILPWFSLLMPLGLGFYTLQATRYAVDVYRKKAILEKNPLLYAVYVSFFPAIVNGPINRAAEMLPQYRNPAAFSYNKVAGGLFRVLWGFFKSKVIARSLAAFTSLVLSAPSRFSGPELLIAILLFAYQFYAEFSGLCDIAIGSARMLGLTFMEDFKNPFAAKTFFGLWQRWHASLSAFLRDCVYLPLGGGNRNLVRKSLNILFVFLLGALWYGASRRYFLWGFVCGIIAMVGVAVYERKERIISRIPLYRNRFVRGFFSRLFVYLLFAFTCVFFADAVFSVSIPNTLGGLFSGWNMLSSGMLPLALAASGFPETMWVVTGVSIVLVAAIEGFATHGGGNVADWIRRRLFFVRWPLYLVLLCGLLFFGVFFPQPSIVLTFTFENFGAWVIDLLTKLFALFGYTLPA